MERVWMVADSLPEWLEQNDRGSMASAGHFFMRYFSNITGFMVACVLGISMAYADAAAQPTMPATQPATADVYLVPFSALSGDNSLEWAGKAVQQNLLTDLARANMHVIPADKPIAATSDAQTAAKSAGAKYVLTGTYQVADTLVRFNGQILDTVTGSVLGGISATGAPRDLFTLEDSLSTQAIQQINKLNAATAQNTKPAAAPAANQPAVVVQVIQPPAVVQPGTSSSYQGSALQQYIDSGRSPSQDYNQQVQDSRDRDTYGYNYNNTYGSLGGYGYGYGYGLIYGIPFGGYHYGIGWNNGHHHHDDDR
jgi:TolB-like protein